MPTLPQPQSLGFVAPEADRPLAHYQGGIAQEGQIEAGRELSQSGAEISAAGSQVQDVQDQIASAHAMQQLIAKKLDLDQEAITDPDYATLPQRYNTAITKAAQDASSGIAGAVARSQFQDRASRWIEYGTNTVRSQAHVKAVQADQSYLNDTIDTTTDQMLRAPDETTRVTLLNGLTQSIDAVAGRGSISAVQATKLKQTIPALYATKRAKMLIDSNPDAATQVLSGDTSTVHAEQPELSAAASAAGAAHNVNPDTLVRTALIESGGNPGAVNPQSNAAGPFQFTPRTATDMGLKNPHDVFASADAAAQLMAQNRTALQQSLGRDPTEPELYLAHQQGAEGASALLNHPDQNAVSVLTGVYGSQAKAHDAVLNNGGTADMSAGDFSSMWEQKFNQTTPRGVEGPENGETVYPKTGSWVDFIPPDVRANLIHDAQTRSDANLTHQAAQEKYYESQAPRLLQFFRSHVYGNMVTGDQGPPTPGQVADAVTKRLISPEMGVNMLVGHAVEDDPATLSQLYGRARNGEDVTPDAMLAGNAGSLTQKTIDTIIKTGQAASDRKNDQLEHSAFAELRTIAGGDAVEKGMLDFGNSASQAQIQLWAKAQDEWNQRVLLKGESPMTVLSDMAPRYSHPVTDLRALPQPREGQIKALTDIPKVAQATKDAYQTGAISADQYAAEQALIVQYQQTLESQKARQDAAAAVAKPQPGRVLGAQPNSTP